MRSNYKNLGQYIEQFDNRNKNCSEPLGLDSIKGISSVFKSFIKTKANLVGVTPRNYKVVRPNQFGFNPNTARMGDKIPIALNTGKGNLLVSSIYPTFKIIDKNELLPEYLMMWFRRPEFDRYARFKSHGSAREVFNFEEMCDVELPVPSIEKQREIVKEYNTIVGRIKINEQLNQKLEETAQALYKELFVDETSESSEKVDLELYVEFNPKHSIKKGELVPYVEMADVQKNALSLKKVVMREFTAGTKFINNDILLARITPCLENGKTAFVDCLNNKKVAYGSTEFIVMRFKEQVSPYWVYCLAREEDFRNYAISSMIGSSGRQRVHSDYLKEYKVEKIDFERMSLFHSRVLPLFESVRLKTKENQNLLKIRSLMLSKMSKVESLKTEQVL